MTDGRTTTYSEHEHEFTFAKNNVSKPNWQHSLPSSTVFTLSITPLSPPFYKYISVNDIHNIKYHK